MSANFVALLFDSFTDVNWLGIYVLRGDELVLGPFQGRPACVHIAIGQDIDSPSNGRFRERDQQGIEKLCATFERCIAGNHTGDSFI